MKDALSFVGSWLATVYETEGPPTRALFTVGADGTFIIAEHPVVTPPGAPGPIFTSSAHGAWKAAGANAAIFTTYGLGSDGQGNLFALVTFRGSVRLGTGGTVLTGAFDAIIAGPDGNALATFPMTLEATRIEVEVPAPAGEMPAAMAGAPIEMAP